MKELEAKVRKQELRAEAEAKMKELQEKLESQQKAQAAAAKKVADAAKEDMSSMKSAMKEEVAASAAPRTYVIQSGDSLSKIAKEFYGNANAWPKIFEANKDKITDPNLIYPGQEIIIP